MEGILFQVCSQIPCLVVSSCLLFSLAWLDLSPRHLQEPLDRTNDKYLHIPLGRATAFPQRWLPFFGKGVPVVCAV